MYNWLKEKGDVARPVGVVMFYLLPSFAIRMMFVGGPARRNINQGSCVVHDVA